MKALGPDEDHTAGRLAREQTLIDRAKVSQRKAPSSIQRVASMSSSSNAAVRGTRRRGSSAVEQSLTRTSFRPELALLQILRRIFSTIKRNSAWDQPMFIGLPFQIVTEVGMRE